MRIRRIYEDNIDYYTGLKHLKHKCFTLKFPRTITLHIIEQAKSWVDRFHLVTKSKSKKRKQNKLLCVSQFLKLEQSREMEKRLQSNVKLAYKRPRMLGNLVTSYRKLSCGRHEGMKGSMSGPCGKCALWDDYASHGSMVSLIKHIRTPNGKRRLTQKLNCMELWYLRGILQKL